MSLSRVSRAGKSGFASEVGLDGDRHQSKAFQQVLNGMALLIADLQKAIGVDTTWGGLATRTNPISSSLVVDQEDKIIGGATVTFTIDYVTKKWDPYNQ